jgi:hypothetical protein
VFFYKFFSEREKFFGKSSKKHGNEENIFSEGEEDEESTEKSKKVQPDENATIPDQIMHNGEDEDGLNDPSIWEEDEDLLDEEDDDAILQQLGVDSDDENIPEEGGGNIDEKRV